VNAIILAAGKQLPKGVYPAYNAVQNSFLSGTSSVWPSWNLNCGMFKVNNSQDGFGMGMLHINGAVVEEYGGRLTGQCIGLGNLFNSLDSTIPYLKCATTSGYFYHLNADPINTSDPQLLNNMGFLGNPVVSWNQVTQSSTSSPVSGQVDSAAMQNS
jgi:hypothetical protein